MPGVDTWTGRPSDDALEELAAFYSSQFGEGAGTIAERLRWERANPVRTATTPFAVCMRGADERLVGAMVCVPFALLRDGRPLPALMSAGYYADAAAHGAGLRVFQRYRSLGRSYFLYVVSANETASRIWKWAGARPLAHADFELLRPLRFASLAEEVVTRRVGARAAWAIRALAPLVDLAALVRSTGARGELTPVTRARDAVRSPTGEGLEPVRDEAFLQWRFLDVPQTESAVFHYRDRATEADGFVAVVPRRRGIRHQIRTAAIADLWGRIPPAAVRGLVGALARHYRGSADAMVFRSVPAHLLDALVTAGCVRRDFPGNVGWYIDDARTFGAEPLVWPAAATELV